MNTLSFKSALCQQYKLRPDQYRDFVLRRTLFRRVRVVRPLLRIINPNYLFNEIRLIEKVGETNNLREIHEELDFYQHKYVVNFLAKDALRFRVSGMRLMRLANSAFLVARAKQQPATGISAQAV